LAGSGSGRLVTAGRVGRPHGLDGSFRVLDPEHSFGAGTTVTVAGAPRRIRSRRGTDVQPILALDGIRDREAALALGGELLLVEETELPIEEGEWLAEDLVGCEVVGLGTVVRVVGGPSCDVLEIDDGTLVPLVTDAVRAIDPVARTVEVDREFLGLEDKPG
jgi:16S rRNA processing protein RimM